MHLNILWGELLKKKKVLLVRTLKLLKGLGEVNDRMKE